MVCSSFQPQPVELPARVGVPVAAAGVAGGEQQPAGVAAGGDRAHAVADAAGRLLQRDHPLASPDWRLGRAQGPPPQEEQAPGGPRRLVVAFSLHLME